MRVRNVLTLVLVGVLLAVIAPRLSAQFASDVFTVDQDIVDGAVTVTRTTSNGPGWMVIHADADGQPGADIGQVALPDGISSSVVVPIDVDAATTTLYAMLHVDEGEVGIYEFPDGPDLPAVANGTVVVTAFEVTGIANTVVGTAENADNFGLFVTALEAAGLSNQLRGAGPYTVFAPTDDAFAALPDGILDALLDDPEALGNVLKYHVVPGKVMAADISDGLAADTHHGAMVNFTVDGDNVMVNDANITAADIEAQNGIIHVIDKVLLPPAEEEVAAEPAAEEAAAEETTEAEATEEEAPAEEEAAAATGELQDIVSTAQSAGNLTTLAAAIQAAGLVSTLQDAGPFTVFAPTDDAFAELSQTTLDALMADPNALRQVLLYHVAPGELTAGSIAQIGSSITFHGSSVNFTVGGDSVMVNDANVTQADIMASNGVIHLIDKVLAPPVDGAGAEAAAEEVTPEPVEEATAEPAEEATPEPAEEAAESMGVTPMVAVSDQGSDGTQVFVDMITAAQAGWITIHADEGGSPGAVLGQSAVTAGNSEFVIIELDEQLDGETKLWAMLHVDEGEQGTYEFPGTDAPVTVDGQVVMAPFTAIIAAMESGAADTDEVEASAAEVATPEPAEEATPEPAEEATPEPVEEATAAPAQADDNAMADGESMAAPEQLPSTGGELTSTATSVAVVALVTLILFGGAFVTRRREVEVRIK